MDIIYQTQLVIHVVQLAVPALTHLLLVLLVEMNIIYQSLHVVHVVQIAKPAQAHLLLVLLVKMDIIYLIIHAIIAPLHVVLVLVPLIVIHAKADIFCIQEIAFNVIIIAKQQVIIVNVQVVMMDII